MANAKEIQDRISSIQDTMKITKAMYMMSSMKLRKAKNRLAETEPFFFGVQEGIAETLSHFPNIQHIYFDNRPSDEHEDVKMHGFIVITGDKGMAGAYNHNAIKLAMDRIGDPSKEDYKLYVVGEVGRAFFVNQGYRVEEDFRFSATKPSMHRARVITEKMIALYREGALDRIDIIYTKMINSVAQETCVERLLPLKTNAFMKKKALEIKEDTAGETKAALELQDSTKHVHNLNTYEYEAITKGGNDYYTLYPSPERILSHLVYNYFTGFMYGALVESSASEENSRMMAMQSATDNAQSMLNELSVEYNRVRQAAITQEITEVVGGAKALRANKKKKKK